MAVSTDESVLIHHKLENLLPMLRNPCDEKENQGFMSAANFLGKEKAAPPNKKLPGHFFKRK